VGRKVALAEGHRKSPGLTRSVSAATPSAPPDSDCRYRGALRQLRRVAMVGFLAIIALAPQGDVLAQGSGYLTGREVDFRAILGPPPTVDSLWDRADQKLVEAYQSVDATRFESAKLDEEQLYPRFEKAFGRPIDRKTSPVLVALLDR